MARAPRPDRAPRRRVPWSPLRVGLLTLVILAIGIYLGFTKHIPFTHGYRIHAVFQSSNNIKKGSPVRIAGVNVGKVSSVSRYKDTNLTDVTMDVDDKGLPIHRDATLKIRPRIFLEGNFFVDVRPGSPSAPDVPDGGTIGVTQTSTPVQLDQVLTALQSNSREDLQTLLREYGTALSSKPTAAENAMQDPATRGLTGAQALNKSYDSAGAAFRGTALVNSALLGTENHDLSNAIAGVARLSKALAGREGQLQDLLVNFNQTAAVTASQSVQLAATVRLLGPTLTAARDAFVSLDAAFPSTRAFAREILPGVQQTAATIDAAFPWIAQTRALLAPDKLGGLLAQLAPATTDLAALQSESIKLLPQIDTLNKCFSQVVLPTIGVGVKDGALTTRRADGSIVENYKEFWTSLVGMAGEGQNFDGNGSYIRGALPGGNHAIDFGIARRLGGNRRVVANAPLAILGTSPLLPSKPLGYNDGRPCYQNPVPDVNGPQAGPGKPPTQKVIPTPAPVAGDTNPADQNLFEGAAQTSSAGRGTTR
ncbi:MAG: Mammalian cell entry related domain protein [Conexibacter sp.]|nr:Mammalian cell entry related domain protein [Conexibacter sp.]